MDFDAALGNGYLLHHLGKKDIKLFIKHADLLLEYGDWLFEETGETSIETEKVVHMCQVYDTRSRELVLAGVYLRLPSSNLKIDEDYDEEFDQLYILDGTKNLYVVVSFKGFVEEFKSLALEVKGKEHEDVIRYVERCQTRWTIAEYKERRSLREDFRRES